MHEEGNSIDVTKKLETGRLSQIIQGDVTESQGSYEREPTGSGQEQMRKQRPERWGVRKARPALAGPEDGGMRTRVKGCQGPLEAGKFEKGVLPRRNAAINTLTLAPFEIHLGLLTSRIVRQESCVVSSHQVCGNLLQMPQRRCSAAQEGAHGEGGGVRVSGANAVGQ